MKLGLLLCHVYSVISLTYQATQNLNNVILNEDKFEDITQIEESQNWFWYLPKSSEQEFRYTIIEDEYGIPSR